MRGSDEDSFIEDLRIGSGITAIIALAIVACVGVAMIL